MNAMIHRNGWGLAIGATARGALDFTDTTGDVSIGLHLLTPRLMVDVGVGRDNYAPLSWKPKAGVSQLTRGWARCCVTWFGAFVGVSAPVEPRQERWKVTL